MDADGEHRLGGYFSSLLGFHYDIREIDEDLYLAVLARRREQDGGHG